MGDWFVSELRERARHNNICTHLFVSSVLFIFTSTKQYLTVQWLSRRIYEAGPIITQTNERKKQQKLQNRAMHMDDSSENPSTDKPQRPSHIVIGRLCTHTHAKSSNSCHDTFPSHKLSIVYLLMIVKCLVCIACFYSPIQIIWKFMVRFSF